MDNTIGSQLIRLEGNLRRFNPSGLRKLSPGLSGEEIAEIAHRYDVNLDPDVMAIYKWRGGDSIFLKPDEVWDGCNLCALVDFHFLELEEALKQGQAARPRVYAEPSIVPKKVLKKRICPFANFGSLSDLGQLEEVNRLWLPCETREFIDYDVSLFYDTHDYDRPAHFYFDSLIHFFDFVNYKYDGESFLDGAVLPETLPQRPDDKRPFFQRPGAPIQEFHHLNNSYCAEVNNAIYFCKWP